MPAAISMEFFHLALLGSGMRAIRAKRPPQLSPGTERLPTPFLSSYIVPQVSPRMPISKVTFRSDEFDEKTFQFSGQRRRTHRFVQLVR